MAKEDQEIVTLALERFRNSYDADQSEREMITRDTRFAVNDDNCQWPKDVYQARVNDNPPRPALVINKIPEKIDQVEGEFRQLEPSVKVRAVDSLSDPKIAEIYGGLIRHIQYDSTARSAYNTSHSSVLYGGRGAWRIDIEDDEDDPFIRCIKINRIPNVLTVVWDHHCKKADKSDSKYWFITEQIPLEEFKAQYPDADLINFDSKDENSVFWRTETHIRVAEYWWIEDIEMTFYRIKYTNENGQEYTETIREDMLKKFTGEQYEVVDEKKIKVPKIKWGVMNYSGFIEGPHDDWPIKYIPIIVESGKEVNIEGQPKTRGMTRFAIGPQEMYNYWSTATTETIALAPKMPWLVTPGMISKWQDQWNQAPYKNFPYLYWEPDKNAPGAAPTREQPPQLSTAYAHELARMEHDIMSGMGIYQAALGDQGPEESGKAIIARQRQGSIGSYTFTDNFKDALIYSTKIIIALIPHVYDTERIIRIVGEDGAEKSVPINAVPGGQAMTQAGPVSEKLTSYRKETSEYINDLTIGKYDVMATVGPAYSTQRQEAAAILLDLIKSIPQIGLAAADILVKNLDVKGAAELVDRVKKLVPPNLREPEPGEQPQQQSPDPELILKMRQQMLDMREAQRKDFETLIKAIKDLAEAESKEKGNQLAEFTAIANQIKNMVEGPGPGGPAGPAPQQQNPNQPL